jgi:hypothetical protein
MEADNGGAGAPVGPTSGGMVRILVRESGRTVPMGFVPGEAEETAEELRAAAVRAGAAGGREVARPASSRMDGGRRR